MRLPAVTVLILLALPGGAYAQTAQAPRETCSASNHLTLERPLARSRAAVARGRLTILALGSSSIEGVGASRPELGFTPRLEEELEDRLPGVEVTVINRGVGGENTQGAARRMARELARGDVDLLVWQLGTNDVLQSRALSDFLTDFRQGQGVAQAAGVDILLVDPQRLPDTPENPFRNKLPALAQMARVTALEADRAGLALFRRGEAMERWGALANGGVGPDHLHLNDEGYGCWAAALGDDLAAALK